MRIILVGLTACAASLVMEAEALAQYAPSSPSRQIHVQADAYARAALDYRGRRGPFMPDPWRPVPGSLPADSGMHTLTVRATGFESARVPIPQGTTDLLVNLQMSRPAFEWGLVLTILGGIMSIAGAAVLIAGAVDAADAWNNAVDEHERMLQYDWYSGSPEQECEEDWRSDTCWSSEMSTSGSVVLGVGSAFLIPGILMMALDRRRDTTYTFTNQ